MSGRKLLDRPPLAGRHLALAPGAGVLAASDERGVRLAEADSGKDLPSLSGHALGTGPLAVSPDGRLLVAAGKGQAL